jgi:hypothetical protein
LIRLLLLVAVLCLPLPATTRTPPACCAVNFAGGILSAVDAKHAAQSRLLCFRGLQFWTRV